MFEIDPYTCDDCGVCVGKCPETAIVADERFPVCNGLGCPLHSTRLAETDQLRAYQHKGFWHPMDTLRDKMFLEEQWNSGQAKWKIW